MLISIDHGNKQVKTIHHVPFTSGLVCSEVRPFGGETLTYQGRYYTLTDQRIPYRRDKTEDERFFVLMLFAIAYELEAASFYGAGPVRVQLAVGLPPAHYGAQQKRFAEYFLNRGTVSFTLHDRQYEILIDEVSCYPQSYAAGCCPVHNYKAESQTSLSSDQYNTVQNLPEASRWRKRNSEALPPDCFAFESDNGLPLFGSPALQG